VKIEEKLEKGKIRASSAVAPPPWPANRRAGMNSPRWRRQRWGEERTESLREESVEREC